MAMKGKKNALAACMHGRMHGDLARVSSPGAFRFRYQSQRTGLACLLAPYKWPSFPIGSLPRQVSMSPNVADRSDEKLARLAPPPNSRDSSLAPSAFGVGTAKKAQLSPSPSAGLY